MRGITYVQAFQYWLKTFAIALPACLLLLHLGGLPERAAMFGREYPRAPQGGLAVTLPEPTRGDVPGGRDRAGRRARARGRRRRAGAAARRPARAARGHRRAGRRRAPTRSAAPTGRAPVSDTGDASPLFVYSLLIATFLGTMGLPHILVRFYTNRDGPAARRTTVRVLGLLGLFYAFPAVYGALGRVLVPELYLTGETDSVVLRLPEAAWPGLGGELLGALVAAGAFAAFMSTASGLLVSLAGTRHARLPARRPARGRARRPLPRRRAGRDGRAGAARARRARSRHLRAGRLGVRAGGVDVLPAAAARHLVGRADRARRRAGLVAGATAPRRRSSPACSPTRRTARSMRC